MSASVAEMFQKVNEDPHLLDAIKRAHGKSDCITAFREAGLSVTAEDLDRAKAAMESGELSDADLEKVAGGAGASGFPGMPGLPGGMPPGMSGGGGW